MPTDKGFFRDAGPVILRLEQQNARWMRLDATQFRRLAFYLALAAASILLLTWSRTRVLANAYDIATLERERDGLMAEHRRLERRMTEMQSLRYAEMEARSRLGMVEINPNRVISLRKKSMAENLMDDVKALFGRGDQEQKGR
jgi:cell division protein FtsB